MRHIWTLRRATNVGVPAGLALLVLWPFHATYPEWLDVPMDALLAIAGFCGLSILLITFQDMIHHHRGSRMRPVRVFDILLGLVLAVPALMRLNAILQG